MKIGFVGLGTMGAAVANNLRRSGHVVTVWNRNALRAEPLVKKGARRAATPRECATGQDLVFMCLTDEKAVAEVLEGTDGVLAGLARGDVLVDATTAGTRSAREVEAKAREKGAAFLCAPFLGSRVAAEKAQLVILVGGPAAARDRARPALRAISARIVDLDSAEQAALMKLVLNAVGGAMMAAFAEALALGASGGLDPAKVVETIQVSGYHSPLYLVKGEQIVRGDYAPRFTVALAEKDQRLAEEAAAEHGARMPLGTEVRRLLGEAVKSGRGGEDICAMAALCFEQAGVKR
jgi:3-hydroxyisobutyrate dehydrogenase-like beta-hydroxyacid dehydrogenase